MEWRYVVLHFRGVSAPRRCRAGSSRGSFRDNFGNNRRRLRSPILISSRRISLSIARFKTRGCIGHTFYAAGKGIWRRFHTAYFQGDYEGN